MLHFVCQFEVAYVKDGNNIIMTWYPPEGHFFVPTVTEVNTLKQNWRAVLKECLMKVGDDE
jgi:hypothetical protein